MQHSAAFPASCARSFLLRRAPSVEYFDRTLQSMFQRLRRLLEKVGRQHCCDGPVTSRPAKTGQLLERPYPTCFSEECKDFAACSHRQAKATTRLAKFVAKCYRESPDNQVLVRTCVQFRRTHCANLIRATNFIRPGRTLRSERRRLKSYAGQPPPRKF